MYIKAWCVGKCDVANLFQYYLVDDTLEIREVHQPNNGRDPFPVLIGRHRVPKNRFSVPTSFPSIVLELSEQELKDYITPKDFRIGKTVSIYGRPFLIYDCDNFTKGFYYNHFGVTNFDPIEVKGLTKQLPKMVCNIWHFICCKFTLFSVFSVSDLS